MGFSDTILSLRSHRATVRTGLTAVALSVVVSSSAILGQQATATAATLAQPHRMYDSTATETVVRIGGGRPCSGTPIAGTNLVATAAHCVLEVDGDIVAGLTVEQNGDAFRPESVIVDLAYHETRQVPLDAAFLVMPRVMPGPSARLGDQTSLAGTIIAAGFQPLDSDGSLLRGTTPHNRPLPSGATGSLIRIDYAVAGCQGSATDLIGAPGRWTMPCGLIPGASGGPLFAVQNGDLDLVGIISTVSGDLSTNGIVSLSSITSLLEHRSSHTYEVPATNSPASTVPVTRM